MTTLQHQEEWGHLALQAATSACFNADHHLQNLPMAQQLGLGQPALSEALASFLPHRVWNRAAGPSQISDLPNKKEQY